MYCPYCGEENEGENPFCMFCGKPLPGRGGVEEASSTGVSQVTPLPRRKRDVPVLLISAIAGGVLFIGAIIALFVFVVPRLIAGVGGGHYFYVVQESSASDPFSAIMLTKADGKSDLELARDRDGYYPSNMAIGLGRTFISPTGKHFVVREKEISGDLLLFADDGSIPVYLSDRSLATWSEGFSPNGKYFAYTNFDQSNNEVATYIVDNKGNPLVILDRAVFGAFLPDSNSLVAVELDIEDNSYTGLVLLDITRREVNYLESLDQDDDNGSRSYPRPFVSPDGKQVYFFSGASLMSVPANGGAVTTVYRFDAENSSAYFAPDEKNLVLLDVDPSSGVADLLLFDPQSNRRVRIDSDIYTISRTRSMYGEANIKFSPNGKYVAYLVYDNGSYDLYVTNIESRQRVRLAGGSNWISFAFSPDNKRIAYIDGRSATRGGSLFISEFDGSDRKRLDTDVWSFQFDSRGRNVFYFTVDDLSRRRPQSELYRIRIDGKNKDLIMPAEDGILTFVSYQE